MFLIEHPERNPLMLAAETENLKALWLNAIQDSSKLQPNEIPGHENPERFMRILGLSPSSSSPSFLPSYEDLEAAYEIKAAETDPEKGGSQESFECVREAYNKLIQVKKWGEEDDKYVTVQFSVDIKKGPPGEGERYSAMMHGSFKTCRRAFYERRPCSPAYYPLLTLTSGLGIIVNSDERQVVFVKKVLPCITVKNVTKNACGEVRADDEILGINGEPTLGWGLSRLVQRLNDYRVPVNSYVTITFQRRLMIPGEDTDGKPLGGKLLEPDENDTSAIGGDAGRGLQDMPSLPAENQTIPETDEQPSAIFVSKENTPGEVDADFQVECDNEEEIGQESGAEEGSTRETADSGSVGEVIVAHPCDEADFSRKHEEFVRLQEFVENLASHDEDKSFRDENEKLRKENELLKDQLFQFKRRMSGAEQASPKTSVKTEELSVLKNHEEGAAKEEAAAAVEPSGGTWEIPEKVSIRGCLSSITSFYN